VTSDHPRKSPEGIVRILLAFTLFIHSPLAWRRSPGADQADSLSALGEHYHEEPTAVRLSEQHEAIFICRVAGIISDLTKRITGQCDESWTPASAEP
jgi:hypothetical protein